jgi:hypothetical protein
VGTAVSEVSGIGGREREREREEEEESVLRSLPYNLGFYQHKDSTPTSG